MSNRIPKKLLLPSLKLTKVANLKEFSSSEVDIKHGISYNTKPDTSFHNSFNLFPVALDSQGKPWSEAVIYILSRLKDSQSPNMATYASIADDLSVYKRFLDEVELNWATFPSQKLMRPTYRFNAHLKLLVGSGDMAVSTAKRTMGTVISFYRWTQSENLLTLNNPAWKETDRYIEMQNAQGFNSLKKINSTDLSINISTQKDPYSETIEDGGQLRPLTLEEQKWIIDALDSLGNTEMKLIHLFSLLTGARIQSVLTLKVKHVLQNLDNISSNEFRLSIGPGTGVDTKKDKKMVLHIPKWLYSLLQIYAISERAKKRRLKAQGGDTNEQYLFLSIRSVPLYQDKAEKLSYNPENSLRHTKVGQGVRQFISDRVIPFIQNKYNVPNFHYRFHDLRATAGMNWTDFGLSLVEQNKFTLKEVREFVKTRMGHESTAVTDRYLQYRQNQALTRKISLAYEEWIKQLSTNLVGGINE